MIRQRQAGFTIIELLIASLVFTTILLLLSVGLIQIARVYYKGLTTSRTQETARDIMDSVTRSIQFNGGNISAVSGASPYYFCVNNDRYSFVLGKQLVDGTPNSAINQVNHVLLKDTPSGGCTVPGTGPASLITPPAGAVELMGTNMRLTSLLVCVPGVPATAACPAPAAAGSNLYMVTVRVVAGEDDLLCSPSFNDCNSTTNSTHLDSSDLTCKNFSAGTQFCAAAGLQSTIQKRS